MGPVPGPKNALLKAVLSAEKSNAKGTSNVTCDLKYKQLWFTVDILNCKAAALIRIHINVSQGQYEVSSAVHGYEIELLVRTFHLCSDDDKRIQWKAWQSFQLPSW